MIGRTANECLGRADLGSGKRGGVGRGPVIALAVVGHGRGGPARRRLSMPNRETETATDRGGGQLTHPPISS